MNKTTTTKKPTKRERFADIKALLNGEPVAHGTSIEDAMDFIDHEVELLNRKNTSEKKPTATQVANKALQEDILSAMENGRLYTISEMIKEFACCADLSTPKVSAVVRLLITDGKVVRTEDKRKAYFSKA